jgi:polyhydroxyalkanoate synthase
MPRKPASSARTTRIEASRTKSGVKRAAAKRASAGASDQAPAKPAAPAELETAVEAAAAAVETEAQPQKARPDQKRTPPTFTPKHTAKRPATAKARKPAAATPEMADPGPAKLKTARRKTARRKTAKPQTPKTRSTMAGTTKAGTTKAGTAKAGTTKVGTSKVGPAKTRPANPKATPAVNPPGAKGGAPPPPERPLQEPPRAFAVDPFFIMPPEQRQAIETLSVNLAKAALTAQGALTDATLRQAGAEVTPDPFHVGQAMTEVVSRLAANPERLLRAQAELFDGYMDLWKASARRAIGQEAEPVAAPAKGDKRFNDPDWTTNPVFDVMKQSYLLTSNWLNRLVGTVEGVEPLTKRRVEFFTKVLTDAFSPSNFLASNPVALREAMKSQGQSLLKGAERFAADLARGGGQLAISQTDAEKFKVGENVATAPGKVVFENPFMQLLQFSPTTEEVYETPLLIFPPWINKYYILDLRPENSMIRWLTGQGYTVFVTSWVNPGPDFAAMAVPDYIQGGVYAALEAVLKQCGVEKANTVGYCIGGTLLATTLAYMACYDDDRINSATFFAAQQDFTEAGDLLLFTNDEWLADLDKRMETAGGVLPSVLMADTFNMLRANDLIWSFFVNNYLMGKEPTAFDLLFWNSDQTRMPRALHMSYLRDYYKDNLLAKGELTMGEAKLDLGKVKTPVYVQSSRDDHIAPMRSVYRGARLFGGPVTFTLAGSGHIAGVINPPSAHKYQHWTNAALPPTVEEWVAGAEEHPGSWWPHWDQWLSARSGKKVPARDPAQGPLKPIEDAPGRYVKVKSLER